MAGVIQRVGEYAFGPESSGTHFEAVTEAIVFQQLSGKAATTIYGRVKGLYGDKPPSPSQILATTDESLRSVGLSGQKTRYLKDLAAHAESGDVAFESLHDLDDDAIVAQLTKVKGVGVWTAQMFLMFRLARPNVLPDLDFGIRKAVQKNYGLADIATSDQVRQIGAPWRPYCTAASLYLWRSLDTSG